MILTKRLPTSDISKLSNTNGVGNISKSIEISRNSMTNDISKISKINYIRKRDWTSEISNFFFNFLFFKKHVTDRTYIYIFKHFLTYYLLIGSISIYTFLWLF